MNGLVAEMTVTSTATFGSTEPRPEAARARPRAAKNLPTRTVRPRHSGRARRRGGRPRPNLPRPATLDRIATQEQVVVADRATGEQRLGFADRGRSADGSNVDQATMPRAPGPKNPIAVSRAAATAAVASSSAACRLGDDSCSAMIMRFSASNRWAAMRWVKSRALLHLASASTRSRRSSADSQATWCAMMAPRW